MKNRQLLLAMLAQLEREKMVSIPQLAQLLGVSEDEAYDALETLVFAYDAASIRLDLHDSYATLETYGTERLLRLTAQEADALVDALLGVGFSQEDELVQALLRTKSIIDVEGDSVEPRMRVISQTGTPLVAQEVSAACEDPEHRMLEIAYQGGDDEQAKSRRVEPVIVFSEESHQYLLAYCHEAKGWRNFRMDRIMAAKLLEQRFEPRDDIPTARLAFKQNAEKAVIRFDAGCELPRWRELTIEKRDADATIVSVPWTGSMWLPKRIVAFMGCAVPLDPASLVDACSEYAKSLLDGHAGAEE